MALNEDFPEPQNSTTHKVFFYMLLKTHLNSHRNKDKFLTAAEPSGHTSTKINYLIIILLSTHTAKTPLDFLVESECSILNIVCSHIKEKKFIFVEIVIIDLTQRA